MLKIRKIAVGISGGVDSAVSALLLKQKGYNIQGVFMQNWDIADEKGYCSADEDFKDAKELCTHLNIDLHYVNFVKQYWNEVFCNLVQEYETGYTPNPDIICNRNIKFNYFYKYALENLKADAIATGHYAKTSFGCYLEKYRENEKVRLLTAKDTWKDQTFFLSQVAQTALQRTMFPVGDLTKPEVKEIACKNGLEKFALKKESMGICFIGTRKFKDFIREYITEKSGDFVDVDTGKVIGKHNGIHQWTLGQRANISGMPEAYFTAKKDPEKNIIYVAKGTNHPILYSHIVFTSKPHWIHSKPQELQNGDVFECKFKFQHVESYCDCELCEVEQGLVVRLKEDKRALTPGQFAVFWKNEECLGSAKITDSISNFALYYMQNVQNSEVTKAVDKL